MDKNQQVRLQRMLMGTDANGRKITVAEYLALSMRELILLYNMSGVVMTNQPRNVKQRTMFAKRRQVFANLILMKLWALPETFLLTKEEQGAFYTEQNPDSEDVLIFVFSTKELAQEACRIYSRPDAKLAIRRVGREQYPGFYLNLFTKGITAVVIDRGEAMAVFALREVCAKLKEEFVAPESKSAVHLWLQKEFWILYSKLTKLPYVVCEEETFDDVVLVYDSAADAQAAVEELHEQGIPAEARKVQNKAFHRTFFDLYGLGVNAIRYSDEGLIQLESLQKKPDFSSIELSKRPVLNPELMLTAIYLCQEERKEQVVMAKEELAAMQEELFAHLRKSSLIVPMFLEEGDTQAGRAHFPIVKTQNGEFYCPAFSDISTAHEFDLNEQRRCEKEGTPKQEYRFARLEFDRILKMMPETVRGVVINPNTINLIMQKNPVSKAQAVRPVGAEAKRANKSKEPAALTVEQIIEQTMKQTIDKQGE